MEVNGIYWDYSSMHGEDTWKKNFGFALRQSPINIITSEATSNANYSSNPLSFTNTKIAFTNVNKGINVHCHPSNTDNRPMLLSGGPLTSPYVLEDVHFHWARTPDNTGSEHEIDGRRFDIELHLVHRRADCATVDIARECVDGLCVLGVFLQVEEGATSPPFLHHMMSNMQHCQYKSEQHDSPDQQFDPYVILQDKAIHERYYTYEGCVTGPPFPECVRWIVFEETIAVSRDDYECLRNVYAVENDPSVVSYHDPFTREKKCTVSEMPKIGDNYRNCCPINGRVVEKSF